MAKIKLTKNELKRQKDALKRFERYLYRFVTGRDALLLPGKETLASVRASISASPLTEDQNYTRLFNDLLLENSKGWGGNKFIRGSISHTEVNDVNFDGSPALVSADYNYTRLGKQYKGKVTLRTAKDKPYCLYFADAPNTCRQPSRRIMTAYEKGEYQK